MLRRRCMQSIIMSGEMLSSFINVLSLKFSMQALWRSFSMYLFLKLELIYFSCIFLGTKMDMNYLAYATFFIFASSKFLDMKSTSKNPGHVDGVISWPVE